MTSERKIAANRINGRKSRGPRTAAGKSKASRNALRHGLSTITRYNSAVSREIEIIAKALCGDATDPPLYELALTIAENDIVLRCVRAESVWVIERMWDVLVIPAIRGNNAYAVARPLIRRRVRLEAELDRLGGRLDFDEDFLKHDRESVRYEPIEDEPVAERDEYEAMCGAMPDLDRLARYERRAWSRRKRAIREFIERKAIIRGSEGSAIDRESEHGRSGILP